jgi:hypothetical protein
MGNIRYKSLEGGKNGMLERMERNGIVNKKNCLNLKMKEMDNEKIMRSCGKTRKGWGIQ